jgi:hypothetical protein
MHGDGRCDVKLVPGSAGRPYCWMRAGRDSRPSAWYSYLSVGDEFCMAGRGRGGLFCGGRGEGENGQLGLRPGGEGACEDEWY